MLQFPLQNFVFVLFLGLGLQARAQSNPPDLFNEFLADINRAYEACNQNADFIKESEKGSFIAVPVDHANPGQGQIKLYAYFKKTFDPKKPTVIYFDGGPGGNSHTQPSFSDDFNELRFDQRGIGCSQPDDPRALIDYRFYSSEFVARDAELIRQFFKIDKISVFGGSYGTIPATMYAHLFAKHTHALVLEGTIYREKNKYFDMFYVRKIERVYESLPAHTRRKVDQFFQGNRSVHFANVVHRFLDGNFGLEQARNYIELLFGPGEEYDEARVKRALKRILEIQDLDVLNSDFVTNAKFYNKVSQFAFTKLLNLYMTDCKEMPQYVDSLNSELALESGRFRTLRVNRKNFCETYQIPADPKRFEAENYRVAVPVTYFQGYDDGRTLVAGAFQHFLKVPLQQAQFILAGKGGHAPLLNVLLAPPSFEVRLAHERILSAALRGELISAAKLKELNDLIPMGWEASLRDAKSIYQASPLVLRPLP